MGALTAAPFLVAGRGLYQLSTYALAVVVARNVDASGFGRFTLAFVLAGLLAGGLASGIPVAVAKAVARSEGIRRRTTLLLVLLVSLVPSAMAAPLAVTLLNVNLTTYMASVGFFSAAALLSTATAWLAAQGDGRLAALSESFTGSLALVTLALVQAIAPTPTVLTSAVAAAVLVGAAASFSCCRRPAGEMLGLRVQARRTLPFTAVGLANNGFARADVIVLGLVSTSQTVAVYAAAQRLLGVGTLIASVFTTFFFPVVARVEAREVPAIVIRGRKFLLAALIPIALVLIALAPQVLSLVYGSRYVEAAVPLRVLLVSTLIYALYWPTGNALNARGFELTWFRILSLSLAVNIGLVTVVAPQFGATGAASAWLCTEFLLLGLVYRASRKMAL